MRQIKQQNCQLERKGRKYCFYIIDQELSDIKISKGNLNPINIFSKQTI